MLQAHPQLSTAKSQPSSAPVASTAKALPVPLDPGMLRQVSGGTASSSLGGASTLSPKGTW